MAAWLAERGLGRGDGRLPPARLADLAPALLGRADPGRPLPDRRRGAGARRPAAGAAARGRRLRAAGAEPARRQPRTSSNVDVPGLRRPGAPRDRHHGHVRRLVLVLPALHRAAPVERAVRARGRSTTGCRWTSTSAASSTRSCTCSTRASSPRCSERRRPGGRARAVRAPVHPGDDLPRRREDEQEQGQRGRRRTRSSSASAPTPCASTSCSWARRPTTSSGATAASRGSGASSTASGALVGGLDAGGPWPRRPAARGAGGRPGRARAGAQGRGDHRQGDATTSASASRSTRPSRPSRSWSTWPPRASARAPSPASRPAPRCATRPRRRCRCSSRSPRTSPASCGRPWAASALWQRAVARGRPGLPRARDRDGRGAGQRQAARPPGGRRRAPADAELLVAAARDLPRVAAAVDGQERGARGRRPRPAGEPGRASRPAPGAPARIRTVRRRLRAPALVASAGMDRLLALAAPLGLGLRGRRARARPAWPGASGRAAGAGEGSPRAPRGVHRRGRRDAPADGRPGSGARGRRGAAAGRLSHRRRARGSSRPSGARAGPTPPGRPRRPSTWRRRCRTASRCWCRRGRRRAPPAAAGTPRRRGGGPISLSSAHGRGSGGARRHRPDPRGAHRGVARRPTAASRRSTSSSRCPGIGPARLEALRADVVP